MSPSGLGCAKTSALVGSVENLEEIARLQSQIMLCLQTFDPELENSIFHILPMYEFSHSQGQSRPNTVPELIARCPLSPVCDRNCAAAQHVAMARTHALQRQSPSPFRIVSVSQYALLCDVSGMAQLSGSLSIGLVAF